MFTRRRAPLRSPSPAAVAVATALLLTTALASAPAAAAADHPAGGTPAGGPMVLAGDPVRSGETVVTGELVQAYAEVGGSHYHGESEGDSGHEEHPAVEALREGHRPGLLSWIETDDGRSITVHTRDVSRFSVGDRVRARLGARSAARAAGNPELAQDTGYDVLGASLVAAADEAGPAPEPVAPAVTTPHAVTVVMVAPKGASPDSATLAQVVSMVEGPVSSFWSGQTSGALSFDVVAHRDWMTATVPCSDHNGLWSQAQAATGWTAGPGKHLLLYVPTTSSCHSGLGTVGADTAQSPGLSSGGRSYVKGLYPSLFAHELGHNVSLQHSDAIMCDGLSDGGDTDGCAVEDYRDWYDVMGTSWESLGSLAGGHSARLGVMPTGSVVTAATRTRVSLQPISSRAGATPRILRLVDGGYTYTVEYRSASGQDSWLSSYSGNWPGLQSGVLVRRDHPALGENRSMLLDMTPSPSSAHESDWSPALPVGSTFRTATGKYTVRLDSSSTSAALSVAVNGVWPSSAPAAPGSVVATRGDRSATVSWAASTDNGSTVTGYQVTAAPGGATCTTATLSCAVANLSNGTAYTFTVKATNALGTGPQSAPSAAVTPAGLPSAPTSVAALPASLSATVSWSAAAGNGSSVTGYAVTASPGGRTCTAGGTGTSCTVTQLTSGTPYTFTVRATNAVGTGAASSPSNQAVPLPLLGSTYVPLSPTRLLDTRYGTGAAAGTVGAGGTVSLKVTDVAGVPASGVTAVVLNVTATEASAPGHVIVYPGGQARPGVSNLNLTPGLTTPNLVVVKVGTGGLVNLYNASGTTHLIADIAGYYSG